MTTAPYSRLLIGTDGSITANRAVERAVELAAAFDAQLFVAYAGEEELGRTVLAQVEAQHGAAVRLSVHLLKGDPADALLGLADAERVDLIMVGNKGMAGAQRFLLGSVPNKISHQATCDVLIVHTTSPTD